MVHPRTVDVASWFPLDRLGSSNFPNLAQTDVSSVMFLNLMYQKNTIFHKNVLKLSSDTLYVIKIRVMDSDSVYILS